MSALTTRDALTKALAEACYPPSPILWEILNPAAKEMWRKRADRVLSSGAVVDVATLAEDVALTFGPLSEELGAHVEHFNAWFEDRIKVRHEDVGGIQCICGWSHGPVGGFRPWQEFHAHRVETVLRALAAALTERAS